MFRYLIFFINFILFPTIASSHVQHYKNLQRVEFDIYRNNDLVGYHKVNIKKKYSFDGMTENKKYVYELSDKFYPALWWNHESLLNNNYVLGQGCRNLKTQITFLKKETKKINEKNELVNFYNIKGDNLDINIGYTEKDLKWVDMKFTLKGDWEYKLKNLN